jgi:HAD superfamily hydrolase (TIGR01549 family)
MMRNQNGVTAQQISIDKIDAGLWDAGGTLFNTYPAVVSAAQTALSELGHEVSKTRLMDLFRQSTHYALETLAQDYELDETRLIERYEQVYAAQGPAHQPPFPGVMDVCRFVLEHGGRNFIVTHRARASLNQLLEAHDMDVLFSDTITKDDPYPRKPDPTSTLAMVERHGLDIERCLVIGDRKLDILAGKRAGAVTCLYGEDQDAAPLADLHIHDYAELLRWLRG